VVAVSLKKKAELDALVFTPIGGDSTMTWGESLAANYTDGIVVLHRGRIVYERYFGALTAERPHIAFSVTKSFFGTLAAWQGCAGARAAGSGTHCSLSHDVFPRDESNATPVPGISGRGRVRR
jgi:hypothetical protein